VFAGRVRISDEEVTYQYDSLNRLISAQTTGPEWGQSFGYDGFGNLLSQTRNARSTFNAALVREKCFK
jgi:YD repeat-containing protein